ncbi:MAG: DUF3035 domain-containing protein [Geminicoccaceae bacterium]
MAILGLTSSALLSGCGGGDTVQEAVGYAQKGPDEMAVIKRPPLIVPPDYNLRPPRANDQNAGSTAASEAARETLIGPSSSIEGEPSDARAILTGTRSENDAGDTASEGQNLLVSRSERAERNLDELVESRAENRVDDALLRRLLAWTPEDRKTPAGDEEAEAGPTSQETPAIVQLVSRSQRVIGAESAPDQADTE